MGQKPLTKGPVEMFKFFQDQVESHLVGPVQRASHAVLICRKSRPQNHSPVNVFSRRYPLLQAISTSFTCRRISLSGEN